MTRKEATFLLPYLCGSIPCAISMSKRYEGKGAEHHWGCPRDRHRNHAWGERKRSSMRGKHNAHQPKRKVTFVGKASVTRLILCICKKCYTETHFLKHKAKETSKKEKKSLMSFMGNDNFVRNAYFLG